MRSEDGGVRKWVTNWLESGGMCESFLFPHLNWELETGQEMETYLLLEDCDLRILDKIDGVGPVDNWPSTYWLQPLEKKKILNFIPIWHMTCDTWNVTCDMWHVIHRVWWTFYQNFVSLLIALTVCDLWYFEDLEEKDNWMNQLMNYQRVFRTAPPTPGLSISKSYTDLTWVLAAVWVIPVSWLFPQKN